METDVYFSAAILGAILALIFIIGWRRIVPVLVVGYIVGTTSSFAQGYDSDNDVPSIQEVRDAILAQKTMLDNYFSGYTAPNKLNDISNALYKDGQTIAEDIDVTRSLTGQIKDLTANNNNYLGTTANNTADIANYSEDSLTELQDITNSLNSSGYSNAHWTQQIANGIFYNLDPKLSNISLRSDQIKSALWSTNGTGESLANQTVTNWTKLNQIREELLTLNAKSLDQDNDVPKLTEIATSTADSYLEMKAVREKMDAVYGDPVANDFQGIVTQQPAYVAPTLETFDEQVASKPSPTIGYDLQNNDTGFEAIPDSFDISGFQNTSIPLIGTISTPSIGGDLIGTINYKMGEHATFLSDIIKPILTAWVCYLILSFTTRKTVDLIAA